MPLDIVASNRAIAAAKAYADTIGSATEESAAIAAAKLECLQSLASDATLGTYVDLADLATGVEEVAELQITHVPDAAGNVTVTVDGTGTPVAVVIGVADVCSLEINEAAGTGGTGVVTLAGTGTNITVEIGDAASVAAAIAGTYAADDNWTVAADGATVTFTAKAAGAKTGAFTWSAGETGATSTLGIVHSVAGVTADTVDSVATKIEAAYSGNANWTAVAATDTVTFTAKAIGVKTDITYSAGTTGCTSTVTVTAQGKAIADQTKVYKTTDDNKFAYWSGSAWTAGDTIPSFIASQLAAVAALTGHLS